ncbi:MAG TPA: hypothetical protein VHC21_02440 [Candidatus Saccharimonadales bacterium]|nr:hypothetical protein [Candidatus Saccharimonadales bacterium]
MSFETIQAKLKDPNLVPGSAEEARLLQEARAMREHETDEFKTIKAGNLEAAAAEHGVITRDAAQHAAHIAVEQVTGEHQIPVGVFDQERH